MKPAPIFMLEDFGVTSGCLFDVMVFTQMHLAIAAHLSNLFTDVMSRKRGSMEIVLGGLFYSSSFCHNGGMGREASIFYRRLADLLSHRNNVTYNTTLAWLRCTPSFSLLRSATVCICGSQSISYRSIDSSPEVGLADCPRDH